MTGRRLILALALLAGALTTWAVLAQPVRRVILKELHIVETGGCQRVTTELQFPIALAGHFPEGHGTRLQVRVDPLEDDRIALSDLLTREALVPAPGTDTTLRQVTWEGDAPSGPFLVYQFNSDVSYTVTTGADFRSVVVTLRPKTRDPAPCADSPAQKESK
jgi:hypothetical protein